MKKLIRVAAFVILAVAIGCNRPTNQTPEANNGASEGGGTSAGDAAEHAHGDALHGGTITDWGGGVYHVEFTVDHDAKSTTVYVLGDDAETPAPVKAEKILLSINDPAFQVELTPDPLPGEAEGTSSRFVGQHESLGIVREFAGTISGVVEGTPYAGDFAEGAGGHHH